MNNPEVERKPLPLDLYEKYNIPQEYPAFVITISPIELELVDNIEYDYLAQGHKIFNSELERTKEGKFTLSLIIGKLAFTI